MKLLKYIVLFFLIILIGAAVFVATKTSDYDIKDSRVFNTSPKTIFNTINDLKTWETWGPWNKEDTTMVYTYPEKTIGKDASYSWTGIMGGSMKITDIKPHQSILQDLTLHTPGGDRYPKVYWNFKKVDGGTETTWGMTGKHTFMDKMYYTFGSPLSFEAQIHQMNNAGFDGLEKLLKTKASENNYRLSKVSTKTLPRQKFIGYFHKTNIKNGDFQKAFTSSMPKAGMYAMKKLKAGDFTPAAIYTKWDMENDVAEFYVGLFLHKDLSVAKEMKTILIPTGKAVVISKFAPYGTGDMEAHMSIDTYMKANKLVKNEKGYVWELYVNDPTKVNPADIQTDIYYSVN